MRIFSHMNLIEKNDRNTETIHLNISVLFFEKLRSALKLSGEDINVVNEIFNKYIYWETDIKIKLVFLGL